MWLGRSYRSASIRAASGSRVQPCQRLNKIDGVVRLGQHGLDMVFEAPREGPVIVPYGSRSARRKPIDSGGKGEVVENAAPHKEAKEAPIFYDFNVLTLADNAGVVTYNVVFPSRIERYQHLSDTWVKENGQWKLKFQQTTLNLWSAHDL